MINSRRGHSNKSGSAKAFRHNVGKTDRKNVGLAPRRGGWRL